MLNRQVAIPRLYRLADPDSPSGSAISTVGTQRTLEFGRPRIKLILLVYRMSPDCGYMWSILFWLQVDVMDMPSTVQIRM